MSHDPLKLSILQQQEKFHDIKMECLIVIQKMADKVNRQSENGRKASRNCILDQS